MRSLAEQDARVVGNPAPSVSLDHHVTDNSLELVVNAWTSSCNLGAVKTDIVKAVREMISAEAVKVTATAG